MNLPNLRVMQPDFFGLKWPKISVFKFHEKLALKILQKFTLKLQDK